MNLPNPFDFIHEIRDANEELVARLDKIIEQLDVLIELTDFHNKIDQTEFIKIAGE